MAESLSLSRDDKRSLSFLFHPREEGRTSTAVKCCRIMCLFQMSIRTTFGFFLLKFNPSQQPSPFPTSKYISFLHPNRNHLEKTVLGRAINILSRI